MRIARCSDTQLDRITSLERELGVSVVAYERRPAPAALSSQQLAKLQALETELNLTLVVYESGPEK